MNRTCTNRCCYFGFDFSVYGLSSSHSQAVDVMQQQASHVWWPPFSLCVEHTTVNKEYTHKQNEKSYSYNIDANMEWKCSLYATHHIPYRHNEINPNLKCTIFECVGWLSAVEPTIMSMTYDCNLFAIFFHFQNFLRFLVYAFVVDLFRCEKRVLRASCLFLTALFNPKIIPYFANSSNITVNITFYLCSRLGIIIMWVKPPKIISIRLFTASSHRIRFSIAMQFSFGISAHGEIQRMFTGQTKLFPIYRISFQKEKSLTLPATSAFVVLKLSIRFVATENI